MEFLDKKSKLTIIALNKEKNDIGYVTNPDLLMKYLPENLIRSDLDKVFYYLQEKEYISCLSGSDTVLEVYVKYKAENYAEIKHNEIKLFLFKSILIPIAVSTTTTLLTIYLKSLFF
ncbi:hypothetical protein NSA24_00625 [Clostridioides mangenotii]|uniref:hypothetical protein n=1 Tax=Metaclostridioides mangenotii TaxID=1540 RepID=UPI002149A754|nr:hypothetical protein [Clostridioides mangenotii]MCR1953331.1 hypothetical protein [Clostridioides mangenotii]